MAGMAGLGLIESGAWPGITQCDWQLDRVEEYYTNSTTPHPQLQP
jgi:hypothetical protein